MASRAMKPAYFEGKSPRHQATLCPIVDCEFEFWPFFAADRSIPAELAIVPPSPNTEATAMETIRIRGARTHNLKNINLDLPRDQLIVITGLSGSGKSSLAFDTLYAEGQRRYVESLSPYARQFLGLMEKPDVDSIEGLSPAIAIDQKTTSRNPRSTVGTVTEIYDYLRLLFARVGHPHCPKCGREITRTTKEKIVEEIINKFVSVTPSKVMI